MAQAAPIATAQETLRDRIERGLLIAQLRRFDKMSTAGESERRAADRKGIKLARSVMWEEGITQGRLPITSNMAAALIDEFCDRITKNRPVFELQPVASRKDDAARLLEGALKTNWRASRMQELIKSGSRLAAYTRPVAWYSYWDTRARNGIGDLSTRIIPGHRCIMDNREIFIRDMEYCGFTDVMSRAKLIELFPDKAEEIEAAGAYSASEKPGMPDDPLKQNPRAQPGQLSRLVADNQNRFTGKTTVKIGGKKKADPLSEEVEAEYLWFVDHTPVKRLKPKLDSRGKPVYRIVRDKEDRMVFKRKGWRQIDSPRGPRLMPDLEPHREPVMEEVTEYLYPNRRHIAWIPQDDVILWDVKWDGPVPLVTQRLDVPIYEYWSTGVGQRLMTLAVARNILWTILFQRLKLSLSGTWLATTQSGLRRNKLTPDDGQVFYAKKITDQDIRNFPVQPLDVAYIQVIQEIEREMGKLIGITPTMQGKQAGRVDTGQAYETLVEQGGARIVDSAQILELSISDWAHIAMWHYQRYATHEHFVEIEEDDGETSWKRAMAIAVRGEFALKVDVVSDLIHSGAARREMVKEGAQLGIYPIPLMAKLANFPEWRRGLRMREKLQMDPTKAWMVGIAQQPQRPNQKQGGGGRSHHGPPPPGQPPR